MRMRGNQMEEQNNKIMQQERVYNPSGFFEESTIEETEDGNADTDGENYDSDDSDDGSQTLGRKKMIIIAVIAAVIVTGIVSITLFSSMKKNKEETAQKHADELLADDSENEVVTFYYTDDELRELRAAGYTGLEIEDFEMNEQDVSMLLKEAAALRQATYEKEILPYFDNASDEFKMLMRNTWVGQEEFEIDDDISNWTYHIETVNADYNKITSSGMQCFIKFYLPDGTSGFTFIEPKRYKNLAESGNIVLSIEYTILTDGTKVITKVTEISI